MIGKKVICINDQFSGVVHEWTDQLPKLNGVYTVSFAMYCKDERGVLGYSVQLEEIKPLRHTVCFSLWRFRFVEEEKAHEMAEKDNCELVGSTAI